MIEIFPPSALDHSILTSVLVGLLVVWFFQETLGWGFSGLVVPGYLASILVIDPRTGAVVAVEAILTWLIFAGVSELAPHGWPWSRLFGRDRFFGMLVASVGVRLALEGQGFDLLQGALGWRVPGGLHSMGLVVVPLMANALWRAGVVAGLPRVGLPILITWLILRFVLLEHTNLSLSNFELSYEDLALDFVGSPRAYLLILTGAWLGSRLNLRFGWDFGGILVPGLLALCWLEPWRIAATVGEALVIAALIGATLRLPALRGANLTGGRPLVLGFTLAWLVKFGLGWAVGSGWPGLRTHELFGFGYLLPTLMALRIVKFGDPFRSIGPTLVTSAGGFALGTALGYTLMVAFPPRADEQMAPAPSDQDPRQALLVAAWENEGPVPTGTGAAVRLVEEALLRGGDGFGGVWVRGGPRAELAVLARVGPTALSAATLAVADALDARVVILCAPSGDACEVAREDVSLYLPVLELRAGETTALHAEGRIPGALNFAALGALNIAETREVEQGTLSLVLSESDRIHAAASGEGEAVPALRDVLRMPHGTVAGMDSEGRARQQSDLWLLRDMVLGPWGVWMHGGADAPVALRVASAWATRLGLTIGLEGEESAIIGPDWVARVDRSAAGPALFAPHVEDEPDTDTLATTLWRALNGRALVLDSPPTAPQGLSQTERPAYGALLSVLAESAQAPELLTVRGTRDVFDPGAEVLLTTGRPIASRDALPSPGPGLARVFEALGFPVTVFDGTAQRASFFDPGNPARGAAALGRKGEAAVTVFASSLTRQHFAPVRRDDDAWVGLYLSPGVPSRQVPVAALAEAVGRARAEGQTTPSATWREPLARMADVRRDGRPAAFSAMISAVKAAGGSLELLCDPDLGCRWLAAERCADGRCEGFLAPVRRTADGIEPLSLTPLAAVVFGVADLGTVGEAP